MTEPERWVGYLEHRTPERDCFYPESPILTAENC